MIETPKPDRVKSSPGTTFASMREKARAGKLGGKSYAGEMQRGYKSPKDPPVVRMTERVAKRGKLTTPRTGHDATQTQNPGDKPVY